MICDIYVIYDIYDISYRTAPHRTAPMYYIRYMILSKNGKSDGTYQKVPRDLPKSPEYSYLRIVLNLRCSKSCNKGINRLICIDLNRCVTEWLEMLADVAHRWDPWVKRNKRRSTD